MPKLSEVNCTIAIFLYRPVDCYRAVMQDSAGVASENRLMQLTASTAMKIAKEQIAVKEYPYHVPMAKQLNNDLISYTALSRHVEICSILPML